MLSRHALYNGFIKVCIPSLRTSSYAKTQLGKLSFTKITTNKQTPIINEIKKHTVLLVRKSLNDDLCGKFKHFFKMRNHRHATRNNEFMLQTPKVKLQLTKSGFCSMGVKIYNDFNL